MSRNFLLGLMASFLRAVLLLSTLLGGAEALARGGGGGFRGGRGGGRGGGYSGGGRGAAQHRPRYVAPPTSAEEQRKLDLFGPPGEWKARKGAREWLKYGAEVEGWSGDGTSAGGDIDVSPAADDLGPPADFAPKMWSSEAGGGKAASFFDEKAASFVELGASDELQDALTASGVGQPSSVQALGFGPIKNGDDVALADQTGSGKTIAYLAPIVQHVREAEAASGRTPGASVRALVLTPTSELAQQVLGVAKALSANGAPFRSSIITGEHKWRTQAKCAERGLELLVCTPGRLRAHLEEGSFSLALTSRVVLDEADLLFEDEDFEETWLALREALPDTASTAFVTATLPAWLIQRVQEELPLVKILKGNSLHRTGAGVQETIVDCSAGERVRGDGDAGFRLKGAALSQQLRPPGAAHPRLLQHHRVVPPRRELSAAQGQARHAVRGLGFPRGHPGRGTQADARSLQRAGRGGRRGSRWWRPAHPRQHRPRLPRHGLCRRRPRRPLRLPARRRRVRAARGASDARHALARPRELARPRPPAGLRARAHEDQPRRRRRRPRHARLEPRARRRLRRAGELGGQRAGGTAAAGGRRGVVVGRRGR